VLFEVDDSLAERFEVLFPKLCLCNSAIIFKGTYSCYKNNGIGLKAGFPAFDIEEFFGSEIGSESRLSNNDIREFQS